MTAVRLFMPFISSVVVMSPRECAAEFKNPGFSEFFVLHDEETKVHHGLHMKESKSYRNYHLRGALVNFSLIREEFIMSDDDYRPIRPINLEIFKDGSSYNSYYFYHLGQWKNHETSYDDCLQKTFILLRHLKYPTLAYSSHMPQLVNKKLLEESYAFFSKFSEKYALCEWSTYFNFCQKNYPEIFNKPRTYLTLCWPPLPGIWPDYIVPKEYYFENYYPHNYTESGLFDQNLDYFDINTCEDLLLEKLMRLRDVETGKIYPPPISDWSTLSLRRRVINKLLKVLQKIDHERKLRDKREILKILYHKKGSN